MAKRTGASSHGDEHPMAPASRDAHVVREIRLSPAELRARLKPAGAPNADDASITTDGQRLGSKEEVLEFLADVDAVRPAEPEAWMATGPAEPSPNIPRIVAVLNHHAVDYLLVGGVATIVHGAAAPTGDVDCLVEGSAENLHRLAVAMAELDARLRVGRLDDDEVALLPVVLDEVMLAKTEISVWRTGAGNVDLLTALPGHSGGRLYYDDLAERAELMVIEGMTAPVACLDHVIASKRWADRPKDRQVLPELRELNLAQMAGEKSVLT